MILRFKQFEGKYDKVTGVSVDELWKVIKITKSLYDLNPSKSKLKYDNGFLTNQINYDFIDPVEFDLVLRIKREKIDAKLGFIIEGTSDAEEGAILIELIINPDREPCCYNTLNSWLQDVLRHEIEHLTHGGYNEISDRPSQFDSVKLRLALNKAAGKGNFVNSYKYYILEDEVGPLVHGMYRKAKTDKKSITTIFNEFLSILEDEEIIKSDKRDLLFDTWVKEAKRLFPRAIF